ncbi:uncharacterized protein CcaverHIS019_0212900 [Cutaneotrichosporon cavernicola]|uniref:Uncharacterized protein n=1 Tax=Cutaneotrichosporon cavernicola TaxID=279322 RepID=A0AA48IIT3_9TREE|nr:uncharacterized protein CcaverHIS019_0212900 [Cutaneotrichosporon cavernicola]BEI89928.1 hypothetical protein CcaverHIS019_0212900 [Cutaneotrichosporon cavernicola]
MLNQAYHELVSQLLAAGRLPEDPGTGACPVAELHYDVRASRVTDNSDAAMRPDLFTVIRFVTEVGHVAGKLSLAPVEIKSLHAAPDAGFDALDALSSEHKVEILKFDTAPAAASALDGMRLVRAAADPVRAAAAGDARPATCPGGHATGVPKGRKAAKAVPPANVTTAGTSAFRLWSPCTAAADATSKALMVGAVNLNDASAYARKLGATSGVCSNVGRHTPFILSEPRGVRTVFFGRSRGYRLTPATGGEGHRVDEHSVGEGRGTRQSAPTTHTALQSAHKPRDIHMARGADRTASAGTSDGGDSSGDESAWDLDADDGDIPHCPSLFFVRGAADDWARRAHGARRAPPDVQDDSDRKVVEEGEPTRTGSYMGIEDDSSESGGTVAAIGDALHARMTEVHEAKSSRKRQRGGK